MLLFTNTGFQNGLKPELTPCAETKILFLRYLLDYCQLAHYIRKTDWRELAGSSGDWWDILDGKLYEITMNNDDVRRMEGDLTGRFTVIN